MRFGAAQAAIPDSGAPKDAFWRTLLSLINAGRVIPIVGQELLIVEHDNQHEPLNALLARRLADTLGVQTSADAGPRSLTQVAVAYKETGDLQDVYTALYDVLAELRTLPVPEPLKKLAQITPLKLFVTTTIDDFLERAINDARHGGRPETQVISYAPQRANDLPRPLRMLDRPTVFHLMGRASGTPFEYAITEEDVLEFVRSLESDERPRRLLGELDDNHVLIIGSGYSDWLARFFVRLAQQPRLLTIDQETTVIADHSVQSDPVLREFLSQFSLRSRLFYADPVAFVDELFERWQAAPPPPPPAPSVDVPPPPPPQPGQEHEWAVFVSYASEDRVIAERLSNGLREAQIPVWFDRWEIKGGERWAAEIEEGLTHCSLFAPLISKNTLTPEARFFRTEWEAAERVAPKFRRDRPFIVPIAVDDTSPEQLSDYPLFTKPQWQRLGNGDIESVVSRIRELFRKVKALQ